MAINDDLIREISKSIQSLFELTTRVDEQVKTIKEHQLIADKQIQTTIDVSNKLMTRVMLLESKNGKELHNDIIDLEKELREASNKLSHFELRLALIEKVATSQESRWDKILNYFWYGMWVIFLCWVVYRLEIGTLPIP